MSKEYQNEAVFNVGWGWYSSHASYKVLRMSPAVEGRDLCQPPKEPPAPQLVDVSLCPPQSSSVGQ